jgi:hypothetical protein
MSLNIKVKYNDENEELFCTYSKERIQLGEKYALLIVQMYDGSCEELPYKMENLPSDEDYEEDDEAPFFSPT